MVEWYEVRWQVELFFRELKSRMQFECYVLMKFEAVERYLDMLLMGLLLLEQQRLRDMQREGANHRSRLGAGPHDGPTADAGIALSALERAVDRASSAYRWRTASPAPRTASTGPLPGRVR